MVKVIWEDTWGYKGWRNRDNETVNEKLNHATVVESLGYFIGENSQRILLTKGLEEELYEDLDTIPRGCIKKIVSLQEKPRRNKNEKRKD